MKYLCSNVLDLPNDILQKIQILLGKKKYMFLYVILSSTAPNKLNKISRIHNAITYVTFFDTILWGGYNIPSNFEFYSLFFPNISFKEKINTIFVIFNEMSEYLFKSPNQCNTHIIWNGKKIQTKKRYTKYFVPNSFWRKTFSSLKGGKYPVCGCTPFCWRCRNRCDIVNVKQGDKLVVKSHENGKYYCCMIKIVKLEDKYYPSVRDIYLTLPLLLCDSPTVWYFKMRWRKEFCPKIQIFVELLPLPHEPVPNKTFQFMDGNEEFYYMADCYTSLLVWGPKPYSLSRRVIMDKVYNIPPGWVVTAKSDAKTALACIY